MINLLRYNEAVVTATDDAILYDEIIRANGIIKGCNIAYLGGNQLSIEAGRGIIKGRDFTTKEEVIKVPLSKNGTSPGRLVIKMDLLDTEEPIRYEVQTGVLEALIQNENCNYNSGIYEIEMATFTIGEINITDFKQTFKKLIINPVSTELKNENLNTITAPGFYHAAGGNSVINKPPDVASFGLMISKASGIYLHQTLTEANTSINAVKREFTRQYDGSAWGTWKEVTKITASLSGTTLTLTF